MQASATRKQSLTSSHKMAVLGMENYRSNKQLEAELGRLERERRTKLRELNQESKLFFDQKLRSSSARSRNSSPGRCMLPSLSPQGRGGNLALDRSISPATSPRLSLSPSPPKSRSSSRSPSPRPQYLRTSLSAEENATKQRSTSASPRGHIPSPSLSTSTSPSASPRPTSPRQLLPKRQSPQSMVGRSASITETTVTPLSLLERQIKHSPVNAIKTAENILHLNAGMIDANNSLIPQIVINEPSPKHTTHFGKDKFVSKEISNEHLSNKKRNSVCHDKQGVTNTNTNTNTIPNTFKRMSITDSVDGLSLRAPHRSFRRNSVPAVQVPPAAYLRSIAENESTFVTGDIEEDTIPQISRNTNIANSNRRDQNRLRSSSICVPYFDHLKDAPRRDSLLRKYVAKRGCYNRTATTLERLISDLAKGVHHGELLDENYFNTARISPAEWEKLKQCRYLRMPSKDENVAANTIDVEAIFATSDETETTQ